MSSESPPHRRSRSEHESDNETDSLRGPQYKRARTNGYHSEGQSEDSEQESHAPETSRRSQFRPANTSDDDDDDDEHSNLNIFQPGAILRVKLTNFVTYENAEFFPGPSLNMVIGPNGTGKSSLVCAICLGLGWGPQVLGRATDVGSYVKNGTDAAEIEIELQRKEGEATNYVVRLRITKDGNTREWWLGGKKTSFKAIQALTRSLSIQIDNLCQFLPQDKVSSFSGLSPVELLQRTQEAAAPPQMLEWHDNLKKLRKEEKELTDQQATDQAQLGNLETRQQNLRAEVERLQERQDIEKRVKFLKYAMPLVEYNLVIARYRQCKNEKIQAQARFKELKDKIAPTLRAVTEKKHYHDEINAVVVERRMKVEFFERQADACIETMERLQNEAKAHDEEIDKWRKTRSQLHKEIVNTQTTIRSLQARQKEASVEFNPAEWNDRVRAKEQEVRTLNTKLEELKGQMEEVVRQGRVAASKRDAGEQELIGFKSREGQLMSKLYRSSKDTGDAWKWIQEHMSDFQQEIYAPPIISCSVKQQHFAGAVETVLGRRDFLAITVQNSSDLRKLSDQIHGVMKLTDITLRTVQDPLTKARPLSPGDLKAYGMDGWVIDLLDGPDPVLAMLCGSKHLDKCAITQQDTNEAQYDTIIREGRLRSWVTHSHVYTVSARLEYGPDARSTNTKKVQPAKVWVDQPIDTSAEDEIQEKIRSAEAERSTLKGEFAKLRERQASIKERIQDAESECKRIKDDKAEHQKLDNEYKALPMKIERHEETIEKKQMASAEASEKERHAQDNLDLAIIKKAKEALRYKNQVSMIRSYHEELLEARIRFLEAESDVEGLEERNRDIVRQQAEEQQKLRDIEAESQQMKSDAKAKQNLCLRVFDLPDVDEEMQSELTAHAQVKTVQELNDEISAEESKLDYIHTNNPNAIRDFETRQAEVDKLKVKIEEAATRLERIARKITRTREKWEPELDKLIGEISDAFSYNFEQIGCAGEVSVHKDDDFDLWSIQIKVKFRENESLQILDQHRQSGGERSVSTIFYLMSLQALAQAPFRVVDEINQGMDPRNERMVHERMVDIACKEHTSQYFLITPKLLTGLRYHPRMKVLCIASGEHMPEDYQRLNIGKIIGIRRAIMAVG